MTELVSIIIPVYNVQPYLARCLESIINQTYPNWEIIIVDDGSKDGSEKICDEYAAKDDRIHVMHQKNRGVSAARNVGLEAACGNYVMFIDPDDWIEARMIEIMLHAGNGAPLTVCRYTAAYGDDSGSYTYQTINIWKDLMSPSMTNNIYDDVFMKTAVLWNKLFSRRAIGAERFREDLSYCEDVDFLARALKNIDCAVLIPDKLYFYFVNRKGNVVSSGPDERLMHFIELRSIYDVTKEQGRPSCGIARLMYAIDIMWMKIPYYKREEYRNYIIRCGKAMREIPFADRMGYISDASYCKGMKEKIKFLLVVYMPQFAFELLMRNTRNK